MKRKSTLCLLIQFYLCTNSYAEMPLEEILAGIWINQLNMNKDILVLKQDDHYFIDCQILSEYNLDLKQLKRSASNNNYCDVSGDKDSLSSHFDESSQALKLEVPPSLFKNQTGADTEQHIDRADFGAFMNYELFYGHQKDEDDRSNRFNTLVELGIFKDYWLFNNAFTYFNEPTLKKVVRVNTTLQLDFPEKMTSLTLGDTTTPYNPLINSLRFGGISWGTNYQTRPGFIYWNVPSLSGSAKIPSTVDLYINGVSVYQQQVTPGDYNLQVGANLQQTGQAEIVVEDILGNRSVQSFPVLLSSQLLRKGLNDYNISMGKLRYNYSLDSSDYRDFFASGFFRRGISNQTSLGLNAAYSKDIQNLGIMWTQAIASKFVVDTLVMASHDDQSKYNYAYGFSTSKDFNNLTIGFRTRYQDQNYKFIGDSLEMNSSTLKYENLAYLAISKVPVFGSINFNYAQQSYYRNPNLDVSNTLNNKVFTVGIYRNINPKLDLSVSYFKAFGDIKNSGASLALTYRFDQQRAVHASATSNGDANLKYQKYSNQQQGFDYSLGGSYRNNQMLYTFDGVYKTDMGDLNFQYYQGRKNNETQFNFKGAVVWLDNQFALTKSVNNAFALVKMGQYPDVDFYLTNSLVSKTNSKGYAFIHNVIPYLPSEIRFDENQLPVEDKIETAQHVVTGLNQRGYLINYPIYRAKNITIRPLKQSQQGFNKGSELHVNNKENDVYPIGSDGTVTLYSLIPGQYHFDVFSSSPDKCSLTMTVTEQSNEDQVTDLTCQ
ncbi:fimbria/pilus outer membrane usher protein [Acinetobacter sp. MD2(2019)]|uniref:fimbria/pilus outer membrane usher protein n=1 Tax=Acinetobacter sp. MD2(2019) TaxID=2605273 RepID=UPI002D1E6CF4|nr:fimbria/pilus outer membrane usher protein [Acinetobacter sp. MD2(2019)]MEB3755138.1 fimbrial biogenesis outer membrane usher protein [Acinetobacter sp. MD2(2019)]